MPQAICRCGHPLTIGAGESGRIVCPGCGARVRVLLPQEAPADPAYQSAPDGFIRFYCPCGRRLKVPAEQRPTHGKCPDCGRTVPVPATPRHVASITARPVVPPGHPETPTAELDSADIALLERWTRAHLEHAAQQTSHPASPPPPPPTDAPNGADHLPSTTTSHSTAWDRGPHQLPRVEAGLRLCPQCGVPVHLAATRCRSCGATVPPR